MRVMKKTIQIQEYLMVWEKSDEASIIKLIIALIFHLCGGPGASVMAISTYALAQNTVLEYTFSIPSSNAGRSRWVSIFAKGSTSALFG